MTMQQQQIMTADDRDALIKRCKSCALGLGWKFPFFLPAVARVEFRPDTRIPTACVDLRGVIRFSPKFAASLKDSELQFVIAHEIMHLLLLHMDRRGSRDPLRFNIANDLLINYTLKQAALAAGGSVDGVFSMPKVGIIANDEQAKLTSEQLYEDVVATDQQRQLFANGQLPVGAGCGPVDADGDGNVNDNPDQTPDDETLKRRWQEVAVQAQMTGRSAGDRANELLANALNVPPPKVRWPEVLRGQLTRALAAAGVDDVSWSRRSRRSTKHIILPGGVTHRCRAAVVIDTSGSMTDEDLAQCVAETGAIVNNLRVPVFLVTHDWALQAALWIKPGRPHGKIQGALIGRGGTSFDEAYYRVGEEPGKFNVLIHLTDGGVGSWPPPPPNVRRLVAALIGECAREGVPHGARVIEVDLGR